MSARMDVRPEELRPPRRSRLYWAVADGLVLAKRNLVQIPRIPELLVFATIQPVIFVLLFRYVFGGAIADLVRNLFIVLVMLVVGLLIGFRPEAGLAGWAGAIGLLLLLSFAFSWVGATIALMMRSVEAVQSAGFIWLFPLTFASSAFVQTDGMPGWLQAFANNQPITQVVDAVRGFLLGQPVGSHGWQALAWCLGILLVFVPLSVSLYRRVAAR